MYAFDHGSWSAGYGGKPWGQIARTANQFFTGHTSLEMLVDTAYTLAHNNGPMFNKGMLYQSYSQKFIMLLDIQRSGQIPELILDPELWVGAQKPPKVVADVVLTAENCPGAFGKWVDWTKVHNAGSKGQYPTQLKKQQDLHPPVAKFGQYEAKHVGTFSVWPGQSAKVFVRQKKPVAA